MLTCTPGKVYTAEIPRGADHGLLNSNHKQLGKFRPKTSRLKPRLNVLQPISGQSAPRSIRAPVNPAGG